MFMVDLLLQLETIFIYLVVLLKIGSSNIGSKSAYKYDTKNNSWTKITDCPCYSFRGGCVPIGTNIYIFGLFEGDTLPENACNKAYKYDTLTDSYTQLANVPINYISSFNLVVVGTDIYMYGSGAGLAGNPVRKYNTLTDTWTSLSSPPFYVTNTVPQVVVDNDTMYFFYVSVNNEICVYKYTISTATYSKVLSSSQISPTGNIYKAELDFRIKFGNNVYLFGCGGSTSYNESYKYNLLDNSFTKLQNAPINLRYSTAVLVGTDVYFIGSSNDKKNVYCYHIESKEYEDNSVVIAQGRTYDIGYNTKLFNTNFEEDSQPLYGFSDAWFYTTQDGLDGTMPVYYGDGTQWINIKNPPQNNGGEE
jgi:N-acetylneuraminic acid mutarotase